MSHVVRLRKKNHGKVGAVVGEIKAGSKAAALKQAHHLANSRLVAPGVQVTVESVGAHKANPKRKMTKRRKATKRKKNRNVDVARAWSEGRRAKEAHYSTDGSTLLSYALPIGVTEGSRKILLNYTGANKRSMTTSQHVGKARQYAHEIRSPNPRRRKNNVQTAPKPQNARLPTPRGFQVGDGAATHLQYNPKRKRKARNPSGFPMTGLRKDRHGKKFVEYRPKLASGRRPRIRLAPADSPVVAELVAQAKRGALRKKSRKEKRATASLPILSSNPKKKRRRRNSVSDTRVLFDRGVKVVPEGFDRDVMTRRNGLFSRRPPPRKKPKKKSLLRWHKATTGLYQAQGESGVYTLADTPNGWVTRYGEQFVDQLGRVSPSQQIFETRRDASRAADQHFAFNL